MAKVTGIRLPRAIRQSKRGGGRLMRSDNLRAAPPWITPDLVGRVIAPAMPVDQKTVPVVQVPTRGVKPKLTVVPEQPIPPLASTHSRRTEESEAANPGPTSAASPRRARQTDWSEHEDHQLRAAYANGDRIDLLAAHIGRTVKATYSRAKKLELMHPRQIKGGFVRHPSWTAAEDELLKQLYGNIPSSELPARIGRTKAAIFTRAQALGLDPGYRQWTRDERRALRIAHERGISLRDVTAALGRNLFAVSKYASNNGYPFGRRRFLVKPITLEQILALEGAGAPLPPFEVTRSDATAARRAEGAAAAERRRRQRDASREAARLERAARRTDKKAAAGPKPRTIREVEQPAIRRPVAPTPSREPAVQAAPQPRAQPIVFRQTPGAPRYATYAERMNAAVAFLRGRNFTVQHHSREEIIARWHVSGWTGLFSNEQLIALAEHHGLELRA